MELKIIRLHNIHTPPIYKTDGAAGMDIYSADTITIPANSIAKISTGFKIIIPEGMTGFIKSRSGIYSKHMISCSGVIDSDYRGEVFVMLHNTNANPAKSFKIWRGDRIAQMVVLNVPKLFLTILNEGDDDYDESEYTTDRGENGFGSTGK